MVQFVGSTLLLSAFLLKQNETVLRMLKPFQVFVEFKFWIYILHTEELYFFDFCVENLFVMQNGISN